jgi:hypothetical protein
MTTGIANPWRSAIPMLMRRCEGDGQLTASATTVKGAR